MNTLIVMGFLISIILMWMGNSKRVKDGVVKKIRERAKEEKSYDLIILDLYATETVNKFLLKLSFRGIILFFISLSMFLYRVIG